MFDPRRLLSLPVFLSALWFGLPQAATAQQPVAIEFEDETWAPGRALRFLGRFQQTNQWERVRGLANATLKAGEANNQARLKRYGQWYKTLSLGQDGAKAQEVFDSLKKAIDYGYENLQGIRNADQLARIKADAEYRVKYEEMVSALEAKLAARLEKSFSAEAAQRLAACRAADVGAIGPFSAPGGGAQVVPQSTLSVVVLTRTLHDGCPKQWQSIAAVLARPQVSGRIEPAVLFYEGAADESDVVRVTTDYAAGIGIPADGFALLDRSAYLAVERQLMAIHTAEQEGAKNPGVFQLYFPCTIIVDSSGMPLFWRSGHLEEWQLSHVFEQVIAADPATRLEEAAQRALETPPPTDDDEEVDGK